jgi:hypothetical protein
MDGHVHIINNIRKVTVSRPTGEVESIDVNEIRDKLINIESEGSFGNMKSTFYGDNSQTFKNSDIKRVSFFEV